MKTTIYSIITGIAFLLLACNKQEPLTFKTLTINKEAALIPEKKEYKPCANIKLKFVYPESFHDKEKLKKLQQIFQEFCLGKEYGKCESPQAAVDAYTENYFSDYRKNTQKSFLNDIKEQLYEKGSDFRYSTAKEINDTIIFQNKSFISFSVYDHYYEGGAHGIYGTQLKSIDLKNLKSITPDDIFIDGYKNSLREIVRSKLLDFMQQETNEDRETCKKYFKEFNKIEPNGNFFITQTSVQFTYNVYEIAPYIAGQIDVKIPYDEIKDLLNKKVMQNYLGKNFN